MSTLFVWTQLLPLVLELVLHSVETGGGGTQVGVLPGTPSVPVSLLKEVGGKENLSLCKVAAGSLLRESCDPNHMCLGLCTERYFNTALNFRIQRTSQTSDGKVTW